MQQRKVKKWVNKGILKFDKTENVLLDIRHVRLSVEENREKIVKAAEKSFDELISAIKGRKLQFMNNLKNHFE